MSDLVVNGKKGRGRPRTGKVLFAARVRPEVVEALKAVIAGSVPVADAGEVAKLTQAVLEGGEREEKLKKDAAYWEDRFNKACEAFPDQQAQYWRAQFNKLKAAVEAKHGSSQWAQ